MKKCRSSPAWIITFSDLMSLLLVFFVLLFVMSKTDSEKFKQMMESIQQALLGQMQAPVTFSPNPQPNMPESGDTLMPDLHQQLRTHFAQALEQGLIEIEPRSDGVVLTFPDSTTFPRGSSELTATFKRQLGSLGEYLQHPQFHVRVIGHTDSTPVIGGRFVDNWELSAARAAAVVRTLLEQKTLLPRQAEAVGMADAHPLSSGRREQDMERNRRVEIYIQVTPATHNRTEHTP